MPTEVAPVAAASKELMSTDEEAEDAELEESSELREDTELIVLRSAWPKIDRGEAIRLHP